MGTDNAEYMVEILSAKLLMRKLKIASSLALAHEKIMIKINAKYPVTREEVKVVHLPIDQKSFTHKIAPSFALAHEKL